MPWQRQLVTDLAAEASAAALIRSLARKQDTIANTSIAEEKVANLVMDLAAEASTAALSSRLVGQARHRWGKQGRVTDSSLTQARVTC